MKPVLFFSVMNGSAWGGSEELWYRAALYSAGSNNKTAIVCFDWPDKRNRLQKLKDAGCRVYTLKSGRSVFAQFRNLIQLRSIPFEEYEIQVISQGGWKDVVHTPFAHLYKRLTNYVLLYHNYDTGTVLSPGKTTLLRNWVEKARCNAADSAKIFSTIEKDLKIKIPRAEVWVNPITFLPAAQPSAYPINNTCIWVMLAALDLHRKAQDVLIHALAADKWKKRNWQLHLYGNGADQKKLEILIGQLQLNHKVFLKGHTHDVKAVLEQCNWLFQCTHKDAMPISVVEAMAVGRPCLVSNIGDMAKWINDGESGYVCTSVTASVIDEQLENIWQNKERWKQMGEAAFTRFLQMYPQPYEEDLLHKIMNES
jgi:glycosyltransferase involved in cell wall biosynthesis